MEKRLLLFLQTKGINPARFAEMIGVQRSSISHILSGRNKPSYDFLLKMMENFPELDAEWLLTGRGEMYKVRNQNNKKTSIGNISGTNVIGEENVDNQLIFDQKENRTGSAGYKDEGEITDDDYKCKHDVFKKEIERIVIFFRDKTFNQYKP